MSRYDSPLWTLCERAAELSANSDWQAIRIDPRDLTVAIVESFADEVAYLDDNSPRRLQYSVSGDAIGADIRDRTFEPCNFISAGLLYAELLQYGDVTDEPVTFEPVIVDVYTCDDCPVDDDDGDGCESDHNAGWALIWFYPAADNLTP